MSATQQAIRAASLSVVVPIYNEETGIDALIERLVPACEGQFDSRFEILLINDGSTDSSWQKICDHADRDSRIAGIDLSRNHGHQLALSAGLSQTIGDYVFVLDADLQDPPELLGTMLQELRSGADVAYGQRQCRRGETAFKRGTAALFYRLLGKLVETDIPRDTGDFRLMTRRVADHLLAMPERYRFVRGMVSWIGFQQVAVAYERDARFAGETHYPLRKMLALAADAVTSFSTVPLRFASHLGMLFGLVGLASLSWVGWGWLTGGTVRGWASLATLVLLLGSAQLLVLGVFGEYLGRMYMETKRRPLFMIAEVHRQPAVTALSANPVHRMNQEITESLRAAG
ncbi:glycosyltransferase family 2 protein [Tsuneonella flava]|uniref:Glycosyltransferase family 2 protein n=1 Tax=Tsuneonella flava TaxID=2055955 RepID=A0ABX7KDK3_9SPHN|nr:glycosyltransferase family 2 protein [Tsuneonella flava]QSB45517.1 glycosyltransferase family 2 protein [Tsuneonella flava]